MAIYDAIQFEQVKRERERKKRAIENEVELLDGTDFPEFRRLRGSPHVAEPELPLDEASYRDYRIRRDAGEGK
jgi:hypothetical protein